MTGALVKVSASLLNSALVKAGGPEPRLFCDNVQTSPSQRFGASANRHFKRMARSFERRRQRSPDRAASVARRRMLGGCGGLPNSIRHNYTEGERAALAIIAFEVKQHGACDLPLDEIAAKAGVSRSTVQNAVREARALGHLSVQERPRKGQKSLTNVLKIIAPEWLVWLRRGPNTAPEIGFKPFNPTKIRVENRPQGSAARGLKTGLTACGKGAKGLGEEGKERSQGHERRRGAAS